MRSSACFSPAMSSGRLGPRVGEKVRGARWRGWKPCACPHMCTRTHMHAHAHAHTYAHAHYSCTHLHSCAQTHFLSLHFSLYSPNPLPHSLLFLISSFTSQCRFGSLLCLCLPFSSFPLPSSSFPSPNVRSLSEVANMHRPSPAPTTGRHTCINLLYLFLLYFF